MTQWFFELQFIICFGILDKLVYKSFCRLSMSLILRHFEIFVSSDRLQFIFISVILLVLLGDDDDFAASIDQTVQLGDDDPSKEPCSSNQCQHFSLVHSTYNLVYQQSHLRHCRQLF